MSKLKAIAIGSDLAEQVRQTRMSPGYGHPVSAKIATGHGPCRHCLQPFAVDQEVRLLFTFNPFDGVAPTPQPGPVFVHEVACQRYEETAGYPAALLPFPVVLDGYDSSQMVRRREFAAAGSQPDLLEEMLHDPLVQYVMVRDGAAGCFDLRIERTEAC
jgi:hypothetical protein